MSVLKRSGGSTIAAISLAVVLFACPLTAQPVKTTLTLTGGAVTFTAPTAADYDAGFIDSPGVTFTVNAQTAGASRTTTVSIRSTSASLGGVKPIAELQWRRSDLAVWNSIALSDAQVEQRVQIRNGLNDPWSNTIFFRMLLNWTTDPPATYTANYVITLSQTVP